MSRESAAMSHVPVFDAPGGGRLSREMLEAFHRAGVILLHEFSD